MKRRTFLKGALVTAGAVITLPAGCGDAGENLTGPIELQDGTLWFPQSVASGDPKANSVVLWTRVADSEAGDTIPLTLEVALDETFTERITLDGGQAKVVEALGSSDHCVRVILRDLSPGTTYYYRFIHERSDGAYVSRTGRTRTAPAPDADVAVRFAFVSCQDFNGHYYNTYQRMAELDDLDFVIHLGDYVYETTGDPSFQDVAPDRRVSFSDTEGAIPFGDGNYFAARTLGQYRELYQTFRSDRHLQAIHERYPMINIWDDHEFSDDSYGATATYFDGRADETDVDRRQAANQAWSEYMPVDYRDQPDFEYDPSVSFPNDLSIWRDFTFGQHVQLVMTDLRTHRSDHPIPEDAFPGAVATEEATLLERLGEVPDLALPYVDIDTYADGLYQPVVASVVADRDEPVEDVTGLISVAYINAQVATYNETAAAEDTVAAIEATDDLPRGLAFHMFGKRSKYSSLGSRYLVVKGSYDIWAALRYADSEGAAQTMMGTNQREWFLEQMTSSDRTWKLWGNEFPLMPLIADVSQVDSLPEEFRQKFYLMSDDWTCMPQRRDELITTLAGVKNVVALTGDIHAFFAGLPFASSDPSQQIMELVTAGVSSNSLSTLLLRTAQSDPTLPPTAAALAYGIKSLLTSQTLKANPHLGYANPDVQGFAVVEVDGSALDCWFHEIEEEHVSTELANDLESYFTVRRMRFKSGEKSVYQEIDGEWKRWDPESYSWV